MSAAGTGARFVVVGVARSGSTMLGSLINSHSRAVAFGELFRDADAIGWDLPPLDPHDPALLALFREDPVRFLEQEVFGARTSRAQAVGFKLFYYHARTEPFAQVWSWLESDPAVRIVHIKRRNALAQFLSLERAHRTGRWVGSTGADPLRLDPEACARHFAWLRAQEAETDAAFARHPILQVTYEDLAANKGCEAARLQAFLGLPQERLTAGTVRQRTEPLSRAVANFAELRQRFAGTPFSGYFGDGAA